MSENVILDVTATVIVRGVSDDAGEHELREALCERLQDGRDVTLDFDVRKRIPLGERALEADDAA